MYSDYSFILLAVSMYIEINVGSAYGLNLALTILCYHITICCHVQTFEFFKQDVICQIFTNYSLFWYWMLAVLSLTKQAK